VAEHFSKKYQWELTVHDGRVHDLALPGPHNLPAEHVRSTSLLTSFPQARATCDAQYDRMTFHSVSAAGSRGSRNRSDRCTPRRGQRSARRQHITAKRSATRVESLGASQSVSHRSGPCCPRTVPRTAVQPSLSGTPALILGRIRLGRTALPG
jgi:hypothetical protein